MASFGAWASNMTTFLIGQFESLRGDRPAGHPCQRPVTRAQQELGHGQAKVGLAAGGLVELKLTSQHRTTSDAVLTGILFPTCTRSE